MLYLVALIPPLAVLLAGKPFQAVINLILTLFFYFPGLIHALFVVHNHYADMRTKRIVEATEKAAAEAAKAAKAQTEATLALANAQAAAAAQTPPTMTTE